MFRLFLVRGRGVSGQQSLKRPADEDMARFIVTRSRLSRTPIDGFFFDLSYLELFLSFQTYKKKRIF